MWRRALGVVSRRRYSTEPEIPSLYSFLRPSIFSLRTTDPLSAAAPKPNDATQKSLTQDQKSHLESALQASLTAHNTDEAWKSFKALSSRSAFPSDDFFTVCQLAVFLPYIKYRKVMLGSTGEEVPF